jgi:hypothetical protein
LFDKITTSKDTYVVGLSAWDILENNIIDLLVSEAAGMQTTPSKITTVRTDNFDIALQLLEMAHSRSVNWSTATPTGAAEPLPNRGHHFIRLTLYNNSAKSVSTVHFVDLVGHGRTSVPTKEPENTHIASILNRERHVARQQLVGLGRIIAELAKADHKDMSAGPTLISTRDSVLSQLVGPLLVNNSKTFVVVPISTSKEDFAETLHSLRFAKRAQVVSTGCVRTFVGLDSLNLRSPEEVLPILSTSTITSLDFNRPVLDKHAGVGVGGNTSTAQSTQKYTSSGAPLNTANEDVQLLMADLNSSTLLNQTEQTSIPSVSSAIKQKMRSVMDALGHKDLNRVDARTPGELSSSTENTTERVDDASVEDHALLERNYQSVLKILKQEERLKQRFAARSAELEQNMLEVSLNHQLEMEELWGENMQLRALVRKMEQSTDYSEVFEVYERDMARIAQEIRRLRDDNVLLSEQIEWLSENTPPSQKKRGNASSTPTAALVQELDVMRIESQRQNRRHKIHQRALDDASRKVHQLTQEVRSKDAQILKLEGVITDTRTQLLGVVEERATLTENLNAMYHTLQEEHASYNNLERELLNMREEYLSKRKEQLLSKVSITGKTNSKPHQAPQIMQIFNRLHELGTVDQKYDTLLNKLHKEIEKLQNELTKKEMEQQRLLALCIENTPDSDPYLKNIGRFHELLQSKIKSIDSAKVFK